MPCRDTLRVAQRLQPWDVARRRKRGSPEGTTESPAGTHSAVPSGLRPWARTVPGLKPLGYAQAALSLLGFAGTFCWLLLYVWEWVELGELPLALNGTLLLGVASVGVFVTAWLWGLQTGLQPQRAASARMETPAAPPRLDAPAARVPPRLPSDPAA